MLNEKFWLAVAFAAFIALLFKFGKSSITKALDNKSRAIAEEILKAKELKEKAEKLLKSAESYAKESEIYSQNLIKDAEIEAKKFLIEAQKSVNEEVAKKTAAAFERIKQEELITIREIKNKIVAKTIKNAEENLLKNIDTTQKEMIIDFAAQDLEKAIQN